MGMFVIGLLGDAEGSHHTTPYPGGRATRDQRSRSVSSPWPKAPSARRKPTTKLTHGRSTAHYGQRPQAGRPRGNRWSPGAQGGRHRVRRRHFALLAGVVAMLALTACERGPDTKPAAKGSDAGNVASIRVVIADYSKDHTRPFWQPLADEYTRRTGTKVDLQVIDWNSID